MPRSALALVVLLGLAPAASPGVRGAVGFVDVGAGRFAAVAPGRSTRLDGTGVDWVLSRPRPPRPATARGPARPGGARPRRIRLSWGGDAPAVGVAPRPGVVHLLRGADPAAWRTGRPHFDRVRVPHVRPGVTIELIEGRPDAALAVRIDAGAAVTEIRLRVEGADRVVLDAASRAVVSAGPHRLVLARPRATITRPDGSTREAPCRMVRLGDGELAVKWSASGAPPAPPIPAVAGPSLRVSTYLGGSSGGVADAVDVPVVAVDEGPGGPRSIVVGSTTSLDFPVTSGAYDGMHGGGATFDVFVASLDADGALEWATFLGGDADDFGYGVAVGADGAVVVTGATVSSGFPVTASAFDATLNGTPMSCAVASEQRFDAFVTALASDGASVTYSTYLGGGLVDAGIAVAVEPDGKVQVGGITTANPGSEDLPVTADAFSSTYSGLDCTQSDGFLARLDPAASGAASLLYCTYLGGPQQDAVRALALDRFGATYVALETNSPTMPVTAGAFQSTNAGPNGDGYVAKLDLSAPGAAGLRFGTFFGGSKIDMALGVAPTDAGTVWVTGVTTTLGAGSGLSFPTTPGALDATLGGTADAFLVHLDSGGKGLLVATLLGGDDFDHGRALRTDRQGEVVVVGETGSLDFPITGDAFRATAVGGKDAFVARVSPDGAVLRHATRVGGTHDDDASGVGLDRAGTAHVVGTTLSPDFPVTPGAMLGGASDPFLVRLSPGASTACAVDEWSMGGAAVALAEDVAVVGAPDDDPGGLLDAGSVTVLRRTEIGWTTVSSGLVSLGASAGDRLGSAVAVGAGGGRVVAGAPFAAGGAGAVSVFTAVGAGFSEAIVVASNGASGDSFGAAVALDGSRLVVGAPRADVAGQVDAGAVHVFEYVGGTWIESATLLRSPAAADDRFGEALDVAGDVLVVGAPGADDAAPGGGAVHRFDAGAGGWSASGVATAADASGGDAFGSAVALDGLRLVVGAPDADVRGAPDVGAAYVFTLPVAGPPVETTRLALDVRAGGDRFGAAVALAGDRLVVGAPGDHGGAPDAGSISVYAAAAGSWRPAGRLGAPRGAAGDETGRAVAVSGRTALAGAPGGASATGRIDVFTLAEHLSTYGTGCAGGNGVTPTLAATGCPGPGGALALHLAGGRPSASAVVLVGTVRATHPAAPGCTLLVGGLLPARLGPFALDACGARTLAGTLPVGAPTVMITMQAFLDDATAPPAWSSSNGLEIVIE